MDVLCESEGRLVEILGRERRRRWTDAKKLEILAAVEANVETLAQVARRYDVSRSQIYNRWSRCRRNRDRRGHRAQVRVWSYSACWIPAGAVSC